MFVAYDRKTLQGIPNKNNSFDPLGVLTHQHGGAFPALPRLIKYAG
jgi:hypothetical protein